MNPLFYNWTGVWHFLLGAFLSYTFGVSLALTLFGFVFVSYEYLNHSNREDAVRGLIEYCLGVVSGFLIRGKL